MNLENLVFCFQVWNWEFDFSINTTWPDQGWIQTFYFICSHDDFNFCMSIKTVKLIQQLKHSSLDLFLSTWIWIVSLCSNSIDFINENDCWRMFLGCLEQFSNEFWTITQIFLNKFRAHNSQECCWGFTGDCFGEQSFTSTWLSIQDDTLWWGNTHILIDFRMSQRKFNSLLDFLNLIF